MERCTGKITDWLIKCGGLIGGASLKAPDFAVIVNAATKG